MPKKVKVTNIDMLGLLRLIKSPIKFSKSDENQRAVIDRDIPRNSFVNSNGKTVTDFNGMWKTVDDNTVQTYLQGFMSGNILQLVSLHYFETMRTRQTASPEQEQPNLPNGISLDDTNPNFFYKPETFTSLTFAFYDKDPNDPTKLIPCAVSIYCLKDNPDFWYMGLIKPTTATPDKQQVHLIAPKELTYYEGEDVADAFTAIEELMAEIHTDKIKDLLHGIFLPEGKVNVQKLAELKKLIHPQMTQDENDAVDLIAQISALAQQEQTEEVKIQLHTLQLSLVKKQYDISTLKLAEQEESARRLLLKRQEEAKEQEEEKAKENRRSMIKNVALIAGIVLLAVGIALALFFTGGLAAIFAAIVPAGVAVLILGNFVKDIFFHPLKKTESSSSLEMKDSLPLQSAPAPTPNPNPLSNLGGSVAPTPPTDGNTPPPKNSNIPDNVEEDHDKPSTAVAL